MGSKTHRHILPLRLYLGVAGALLVLTAVTVAVSFVNLGAWNLAVAMLVAGTKAALVALIFMHLLYDNKLYLIIFLTSIAFLAIFIIFTMFDTMQRDQIYEVKGGAIKQEAAMYENRNDTGGEHAAADTTGH